MDSSTRQTIQSYATYTYGQMDKKFFKVESGCWNINGYVQNDSISFTNKELNDELTTFLYKNHRHSYIWGLIKTGKYYDSKIYSKCKNDTIRVQKNIKIN